ncbi:mRNA-capping enzyme-like [Histomonas meleagridis]|uniref:mRNA-capping enzyme-like n=1 Tax=Histomonas meleagridis TaxID=135588 RepID=UPI00355992FF|nr:mRNA-capping enzyme-like [Histomonas meleagridis]KAH0800330.1 mRNA-capping enzyme-like [Histomonas meleagridis]
MGKPIQVPRFPNFFLIPMKTPLPSNLQRSVPPKMQWTIQKAVMKASKYLNFPEICYYVSIDLTNGKDLTSLSECKLSNVVHWHIPIPNDYPGISLKTFCEKIYKNFVSPGYPHAIMISCNNGFNRTGFAISGFLMWSSNYSAKEATEIFAQARPPGIFSKEAIPQLNNYQGSTDESFLATISPLPDWVHMTNFTKNRSKIALPTDYTPTFIHSGGILEKDHDKIKSLVNLLRSNLTKYFKGNQVGGFKPTTNVWKKEYKENLISKFPFRCTYVPRGTPTFFLCNSTDCFYVTSDCLRFWKYDANIKCPLPIVCTSILSSVSFTDVLFLTDLLLIGDLSIKNYDLDIRLSKLWHEILSNITETKSLQLRFRAVGRLLSADSIFEVVEKMFQYEGFKCDGMSLISNAFPVGMQLFVPIHPSFKLKFLLNTPHDAFLYGRNEGATYLFPCFYFPIKETPELAELDKLTVRFEIGLPNMNLIPIAICDDDENCDYVEYVNEVIRFYNENMLPQKVISECVRIEKRKNKL